MRGKALQLCHTPPPSGITPAHAGKSGRGGFECGRCGDHPRTCGEKPFVKPPSFFGMGSPPHMRGKVSLTFSRKTTDGITPAHAGKSYSQEKRQDHFRDHPRTCGEKCLQNVAAIEKTGSPPHMRGKVVFHPHISARRGITPAHAGKRRLTARTSSLAMDHPRTCGEKPGVFKQQRRMTGSPPHMRGKVSGSDNLIAPHGITPAHAGKSCIRCPHTDAVRDHPRTCGEKSPRYSWRYARSGSPPHMRGKVRRTPAFCHVKGITPAHAGKSSSSYRGTNSVRDHPRTCGEKAIMTVCTSSYLGSPPHMRGKVISRRGFDSNDGITPAHAGKS